jgi:hypothetical protein
VVEVLFVVTCGLGKMVGKEVGGEEGWIVEVVVLLVVVVVFDDSMVMVGFNFVTCVVVVGDGDSVVNIVDGINV